MAGFFDQSGSDAGAGFFSDPTSMALLNAMAGAFQSSAPSRLPVTPGMVLGNTIQGGIQGAATGTKIGAEQAQTADVREQIEQRKLANTLAQRQFDIQTSILKDAGLLPADSSGPSVSPSMGGAPSSGTGTGGPSPSNGSAVASGGALGSPFMANAIRQSAIANAVVPGAGKDVMGKLIPAPTKAEQYLALAQAAPEGSEARTFWTKAAQREAQGPPIAGRPGGPLYDATGNIIGYSPPAPPAGHQYIQTPNGVAIAPVPGGIQAEATNAGIAQGAIAAREAAMKAMQYYIDTGQPVPPDVARSAMGSGGAPAPGVPQLQPPRPVAPVQGTAPQPMPMGPPSAIPPTPIGTPAPISAAPSPVSQAPAAPIAADKPIPGPLGSSIPPPSEQAPIEKGADYLKKALPLWAEREADWSKNLQPAQAAEVRFKAIGEALKAVEGGTFTTQKAQINAAFKSLGLPEITDTDPAKVQIILKNNTQATLDLLKSATSRFTQMEFDRVGKALADPNLQPEALQTIIAESLGQTRYGTAIAQSWADAKRLTDPKTGEHWRNPIDYERAFTKANPMQDFVDRARAEIGPLKGMKGADIPKEKRPALQPGFQWTD